MSWTINAIRDDQGRHLQLRGYLRTSPACGKRTAIRIPGHARPGHPPAQPGAVQRPRPLKGLSRAQRHQHRFAIPYIDLDNFKDINDSLGHEYGDKPLQRRRTPDSRRARAGFGGLTRKRRIRRSGGRTARGRDRALCRTLPPGPRHTPLSATGFQSADYGQHGYAFYPSDGEDVGALLQSADAAMHRAKESGRNTGCYSSAEIRCAPAERLGLINGLRQALASDDELRLVHQPQHSLPDKCPIGLEALLRWNSPVFGEVPPSRFIPLAEESGLILPLTEWFSRPPCVKSRHGERPAPASSGGTQCLAATHPWPWDRRSAHAPVALLRPFPRAVTVEITEGAMGSSPDIVASTLLQLKGMGVPAVWTILAPATVPFPACLAAAIVDPQDRPLLHPWPDDPTTSMT